MFGRRWLMDRHAEVETIRSEYFALPLPRIEAFRNRGRTRALVEEFVKAIESLRRFQNSPLCADSCKSETMAVSIVSHSNGGVLALQVARKLIAMGVPIRAMVLIAPALRTGPATREIAGWLESGMLDYALLVRPTRDLLISSIGANWRTRLFSWPWGSLGHDGWALDCGFGISDCGFPNGMETLDLSDMGHSDPVSMEHREWLFESVIAPALGLAPWGELEPRGGIEG